ncbi:hypothetical protein A0H81_13888 [Grifola frondosa]|uniref:Uncharacterized protein n=1 Tax=Grifola frondosa TaxID=5627 RepID=A0A1C7LNM3_GRIFR|nr:hypothetical protein A0H81_13888 [Grifola frondosa]
MPCRGDPPSSQRTQISVHARFKRRADVEGLIREAGYVQVVNRSGLAGDVAISTSRSQLIASTIVRKRNHKSYTGKSIA